MGPMATTVAPTQVVYLDFSGHSTTTYSQTHPQHVYTTAERNAIQSRLVTAYTGFSYQFTLSQLSTWDYFHPNVNGQAALASVSYAAGFNW